MTPISTQSSTLRATRYRIELAQPIYRHFRLVGWHTEIATDQRGTRLMGYTSILQAAKVHADLEHRGRDDAGRYVIRAYTQTVTVVQ